MMHLLSTPFLPKFPALIQLSSLGNERKMQIKITTNSSFPKFPEKSIKKLVTYTKNLHLRQPTPSENETTTNKQPLPTIIFKTLDDFVSNFMYLPLTPSIDPKYVLSGNFAPVDELRPTACEVVEGSLPSCLDGAYIRNGPNPQFIPSGPYHLFDGDGMLHSIRISGGKAMFCSRYVKTYKYRVEGEKGYPFIVSPFSSFNGRVTSIARFVIAVTRAMTGYYKPLANGFGTANTSVALFGRSLFALCEADLPYEIKVTSDGDIITLGRREFFADQPSQVMTAHPKIDSDTGELFAYRCNIKFPFLSFFRIDASGRKSLDLPISSIRRISCTHDFALTKKFIAFQDLQIEMNLAEIIKGRSPVVFDRGKTPRIGVLPRSEKDEAQLLWIDVPGVNLLHVTNAWEEDCGNRMVFVGPNLVSVEHGLDSINSMYFMFEKIIVDVKEKKLVRRQPLSTKNMELGIINRAYAGNKNKYVYAAIIAEMPKAAGLVKLDLSLLTADGGDCAVATRLYGPGCYGGEPYFVPRDVAVEEDDGYLVTYVHDENNEESWFLVMEAKSPTLDIVAKVRLPGRVPYGFHGLFVAENDLK